MISKFARRALILFSIIFLLSGCVKQHVDMSFPEDLKTVDIDMVAAVDVNWAKENGVDVEAETEDKPLDASAFSSEAYWEDWEEGDFKGKRLVAMNTPVENMDDGTLFSLETVGSVTKFETTPLLLGWTSRSASLEEIASSDADLRFRVKMPGTVLETNGVRDGDWVVWTEKDATKEIFEVSFDITHTPNTSESATDGATGATSTDGTKTSTGNEDSQSDNTENDNQSSASAFSFDFNIFFIGIAVIVAFVLIGVGFRMYMASKRNIN